MKKVISVVVPMFNEEAGIGEFLSRQLLPVLLGLKYKTEVILVDDGSQDRTIEKVRELAHGEVKLVALTRNFGKEIALTAGLKNASGDAVIMIDADGQHPVDAIPEMVKKWEEGAKVVTAVRNHNTTKHKIASKLYYSMMHAMGNKQVVAGALDYRLLDREVVDDFNGFTEQNRLVRGLVDWLGYPQVFVKVKTLKRLDGKPTYSSKKLIRLALDSLVSSSRTPLVIIGYIGLFMTVVSLLLGLFILIQQYIMGDPLGLDWSGAVAMSVLISFLVGLVLISQAITAMYISQIHSESKGRPLYVIDKSKSIGMEK